MRISPLIRAGLTGLRTVYALVNSNGQILAHDPLFPQRILVEQNSVVGWQFLDVLPEFMGQEQELGTALEGA